MSTCNQCGITTRNPKYCSRSCAAKFNNSKHPKIKRKPSRLCRNCGQETGSRNITKLMCNECSHAWHSQRPLKSVALSDLVGNQPSYIGPNKFVKVRSQARVVARREGMNKCERCGYSLHVEIAHVKPLCRYDMSTPIEIINSPDQLLALCPNCHWEFDHGLFTLTDVRPENKLGKLVQLQ